MGEQKLDVVVLERACNVKLLLMDCDGVLTDGKLYYSANGEALKVFHVRDGQGLVNWHSAGYRSGIITGRKSKMLELRAEELGIEFVKQSSADKQNALEEIISSANVKLAEVAFIGDDVPDLTLFGKVGLSVAVADASEELLRKADYVTNLTGGHGAVREVIELLFTAKKAK